MTHQRPWLATYDSLGLSWNEIPELPEKTLSDYIRDHADQFGDRVALYFSGREITYKQLNQCADSFAICLKQQGINAGDVIAVQLPNTPQYVVVLVAAARIGAVVTSVSPLLTQRETLAQLEDANASAMVMIDSLFKSNGRQLLEASGGLRHIWVSSLFDMLEQAGAQQAVAQLEGVLRQESGPVSSFASALQTKVTTPLEEAVSLDRVLYLQYTGGTTGKAKGAQLTSRNLLINNVQANLFYGYRLGQETVASAFPFFHIGGVAVLLNALRTAATFLVIPDPRNIDDYCAAMERFTPTVLANVPTLYQMLMASERFRALDFSQLRMAISGAAPFPEEQIRQLESIIGKNKYCEVYGMTETSPVQTLNPAERFKPGFVGVPLPGTDLRIVDPKDPKLEMLMGEPGEVAVAGPQVMQGYLGSNEANKKALVELDGKIWMLTGDVGFLDNDGYLKICDRSKDMLIVGGYKVFSVEVENKLQELPFVAMSAVVGTPDSKRPGNDVVNLFVQPEADPGISEQAMKNQILAFCRENMAPYKVPKVVEFINALPLTSVGKINKKELRTMAQAQCEPA